MIHEVVRVTPKLAAEWLARPFDRQRRITDSRVRTYARAMADGRWLEPTIDPIAFTSDGLLLNGQHRLQAVIQSDWSGEMLIARDVDPALFGVIDTPLGRRASQFVQVPSAAHVTTVARHVLWYDQRWPIVPRGGGALSFDNDELLAYIDAHDEALVQAVRDNESMRKSVGVPHNAGATVLYIARRDGADEGRIEAFVEGVARGVNLAADDPRYRLRERMIHDPQAHRDRGAAWQLVTRSFNAWVQGRPLTQLIYDPKFEPPRVHVKMTRTERRRAREADARAARRDNDAYPGGVPA